jgi:hypothetical protein
MKASGKGNESSEIVNNSLELTEDEPTEKGMNPLK